MLIRHKKGQVAVLDLFIAALIFGIIVATIMFTWNSYNAKINKQIESNTDLLKAYHISDLLTRYPGKPSAWEIYVDTDRDVVTTLGLVNDDHIIDNTKLEEFIDLDYNFTKDKLRINEYNFYFRLLQFDGSDFNPPIEKGQIIDDVTVLSLRRYVIYNEEEAILEFRLQK